MKYKVGDKAVIIYESNGHQFNIGDVVTIKTVNKKHEDYAAARFDGEYWYVTDENLKPFNA